MEPRGQVPPDLSEFGSNQIRKSGQEISKQDSHDTGGPALVGEDDSAVEEEAEDEEELQENPGRDRDFQEMPKVTPEVQTEVFAEIEFSPRKTDRGVQFLLHTGVGAVVVG